MLRLLLMILKDEEGILPAVALGKGAGLVGGGALMSSLLGENKQEVYDPYGDLRGDYQTWLKKQIGQATPYQYNPDFELPQPGIEVQTEGVISNRLGNLPKAQDYTSKVEAAKTQALTREKDAAVQQQEEEKNMYNRLGLASSTPWMERAGELGDESLMRQGDITSGYDMYGLNYGLQADQLVNDIINQSITQGQTLGQAQRGYEQFPITMSEQDIARMAQEKQGYASITASLLGANPPQVTNRPNAWSQLGGASMDIGSMMIMAGLLK